MTTVDNDDLASFGERVKHFRIQRGLTQSELAEQVDLDRKTVNRLEAGHYSTSLRNVFRIAAALNIVPANLFAASMSEDELSEGELSEDEFSAENRGVESPSEQPCS